MRFQPLQVRCSSYWIHCDCIQFLPCRSRQANTAATNIQAAAPTDWLFIFTTLNATQYKIYTFQKTSTILKWSKISKCQKLTNFNNFCICQIRRKFDTNISHICQIFSGFDIAKSSKSVNFWQSYSKNKKVDVFWNTVCISVLYKYTKVEAGHRMPLSATHTCMYVKRNYRSQKHNGAGGPQDGRWRHKNEIYDNAKSNTTDTIPYMNLDDTEKNIIIYLFIFIKYNRQRTRRSLTCLTAMSQWFSQREPVQIKVQRTYRFSVGDSFELSGIQFTPPKRTRHRQIKNNKKIRNYKLKRQPIQNYREYLQLTYI